MTLEGLRTPSLSRKRCWSKLVVGLVLVVSDGMRWWGWLVSAWWWVRWFSLLIAGCSSWLGWIGGERPELEADLLGLGGGLARQNKDMGGPLSLTRARTRPRRWLRAWVPSMSGPNHTSEPK